MSATHFSVSFPEVFLSGVTYLSSLFVNHVYRGFLPIIHAKLLTEWFVGVLWITILLVMVLLGTLQVVCGDHFQQSCLFARLSGSWNSPIADETGPVRFRIPGSDDKQFRTSRCKIGQSGAHTTRRAIENRALKTISISDVKNQSYLSYWEKTVTTCAAYQFNA